MINRKIDVTSIPKNLPDRPPRIFMKRNLQGRRSKVSRHAILVIVKVKFSKAPEKVSKAVHSAMRLTVDKPSKT